MTLLLASAKKRQGFVNPTENAFLELARSLGWSITKRGWPDFLCLSRSGEWFAVECKPMTKYGRPKRLKPEQVVCMDFLKARGVRCYVSDGEKLYPYRGGPIVAARSGIAAS